MLFRSRRIKADSVADLKHLAPVLSQLTKQGRNLAMTIERVVSWPFPHNALSVIKGDYGGMYGTISLDVDAFQQVLAQAQAAGGAAGPAPVKAPVQTGVPQPGLAGLLGAGDLAKLPDAVLQAPAASGIDLVLDDLLGGGR